MMLVAQGLAEYGAASAIASGVTRAINAVENQLREIEPGQALLGALGILAVWWLFVRRSS